MPKEVWECRSCGKEFKTRSGRYKHEKKCDIIIDDESVEDRPVEENTDEQTLVVEGDSSAPTSPLDDVDSSPTSSTSSPWTEFTLDFDEEVTETMPTPLKMAVKQTKAKKGKKQTAAEKKAEEDLNIQLLKSGLTITDSLLTRYAQAVTLDENYTVKHFDADKNMVAGAQWRYLKSKDILPSAVINEGLIAGGMTAWYVGAPLMKIRKKSKVPMLGKVTGGLRRLPLIGRFLGRRKKNTGFAQEVQDNE